MVRISLHYVKLLNYLRIIFQSRDSFPGKFDYQINIPERTYDIYGTQISSAAVC